MALKSVVRLRRFQFRDALITAPAGIGLGSVALRVLDTAIDGIYGSIKTDALVIGDDVLVSLCAALHLARSGRSVLLSPDTLGMASWPKPDYGQNCCAIYNHWDVSVAKALATHIDPIEPEHGFMKAFMTLVSECASTKKIALLDASTLQSSHGHIRGTKRAEILFPVLCELPDSAPLNPLWKIVRRLINTVTFNRQELEFVEARKVFLTTHPSQHITTDSAHIHFVGQARSEKLDLADESWRLDDIQTAFSLRID